MSNSAPYFLADAVTDVEFMQADAYDTVVVKLADYPMTAIPAAFDSTFAAVFPVLGQYGITPAGPAFALYHRMPTETVTFEVGIPVDTPLANPVTTDSGVVVEPSELPAGDVARISYFGPYDEMSEGWGAFMYALAAAGKEPDLPFWELYVTEPSPDIDPATLRTDLVVKVRG